MKKKVVVLSSASAAVFIVLLLFRSSGLRSGPDSAPAAPPERQARFPKPAAAGNAPAAQGAKVPAFALKSTTNLLPPSPDPVMAEGPFRAFEQWVSRYEAAVTAPDKASLEPEGVELARARRTALADLIQSDPERALQWAVGDRVRELVPAPVAALLEEQVTATGDLQVMAVRQLPGTEHPLPPVVRAAIMAGETYEVFTYGKGVTYVTRQNVPLNGIAVDVGAATDPPRHGLVAAQKLMALDPNPVRVLAYRARLAALQVEPFCSVSGLPTEVAAQLGNTIRSFCGHLHAEEWANAGIAAAGLDVPSGDPGALLTAASTYTEGRKRMLLMRPVWSDFAGGMTTNDALTHFQNFSNYIFEMSYGKLVLAPLGWGSEVTPPMTLPGLVAEYDNTGLGKLYTTARSVAQANYGYDLTKFDFTYVCTGARPAADYAGLAFVGSVGLHLANSYWDAATACHEFGHNLGLNHAHFWDTDLKSVIGAGVNDEYGDKNDPMGGGGSPNCYNARYKNYLGWIPDSDVADLNVTGSGRYRLSAFDLDTSVGLRGMKFRRNASQNYWVQIRQRKVGNKALMNGVQLLWTGNANEGSYLLDVRLKGNSDNNALVIGRTFSDTNLPLHITPVRLGHTFPESIDVQVRVGASPGNRPPSVAARVDNPGPALNQTVTFTAAAADPDGDELAYFWDFGDGDFSVDNSAITTHAFTAAGDYRVQCTVSDMKGQSAAHSLMLRVGSPVTFRISGRVLDAQNRALSGMLVRTDTGRTALSDSDGSYTIAGLGAGSYGLDAIEPVAGFYTFVHPTFSNPVTVGPNATDKDLIGLPGSLTVGTPLLARASSGWRYLDNGVDQGTGWRASAFNDTAWASGTGPLGYPAGAPITTVISFGSNPSAKHITYYFRRQFFVADPAAYTGLQLEVLRDDGVVLYLNGAEAYRNNMPGGTIAYGTTASTRLDAGSYLQASLNRSLLAPGNNVMAAEVHQFDGASSDIVFDAALNGLSLSNVGGLKVVYLSSPANQSQLLAPPSVTLTANAFTSAGSISLVEFFVDGAKIGENAAVPYSAIWSSPSPGPHTLTAVATISGDGTVASPPVSMAILEPADPAVEITGPASGADLIVPTNVTVDAKVAAAGQAIRAVQFFVDGEFLAEDLTVPYSASLSGLVPGARTLLAVAETMVGGTFTSAPVTITLAAPSLGAQLISFGESWSYLDDGSDQGTGWTRAGFDDRGWSAGPARLGYGGDGELTTVYAGPASSRYPTVYFRKRFVVEDPTRYGRVLLQLLRDDGAVVHLNGVEVLRDNLLPGLVSYNSFAIAPVEGAAETTPVEVNLSPSLFVAGTNVLAVEVHQVALASTDLGFDLALVGFDPVPPTDSFYLIQPAQGTRYVAPASVTIAAYAAAELAPASVAYYADGGFLGFGSNTAASPFLWTNALQGPHALMAVVDWGGGITRTSAAVNISVVSRPPSVQPSIATVIPAGSNWRYWDSLTPVGSGWTRTDFIDSAWPLSPARFGWGLDGERTPLTEGRITTYFRRWFVFPNPGVVSELVFQLARDDGAVVYFNGAEVFRSNMPGGQTTPDMLALGTVNPPEETIYFPTTIPASGSGLVLGSNLVAVELHQSSAASSDAGFDLQLILQGTTEPRVYLTTPTAGASFTSGANVIPIEAIARGAAGAAVTNVEFFADGASIGERTAAPWKITWDNAAIGEHLLTARSQDVTGFLADSPPLLVSVGRTFVSTLLIASNSVWKYLVSGANQGTAWTTPAYNDIGWQSGPARLGYGGDGEVTMLGFGGNASSKFITTYFRKNFVVTGGAVYTNLICKLLRDDGAVIWLNGRELFRSNMPNTPINYLTLASTTVTGTDEQTYFVNAIATTNLVSGTNLIAVEMHQAAPDSSDLGFNLEVTATGYLEEVAPPRLSVVFADGAVEVSWPNTAVGYRVYEASVLETPAGAWTASVGSLVQLPGRFIFTITAPSGLRFYRLGKP